MRIEVKWHLETVAFISRHVYKAIISQLENI